MESTALIDFSGVEVPFSAMDLLLSSMGLLGVIAGFIALGLAFAFAPKIIDIIKTAAK